MKLTGERSIASLIRIILDGTWWLGSTGLVLLGGLLVFSFCADLRSDNLTMDLPIAVQLDSPVYSHSASMESNARIEKLRGNLRFPVRSSAFFSGSIFLILLLLGTLLWAVTQLRHVFRSLSRGVLFSIDIAKRLRYAGLTVILVEFARTALVYFWSDYTSRHFTANGLRFVASADLNGIAAVSGLAILVIAEVFREGARLHEEQSLTI